MNLVHTREFSVSVDNLKAAIETFLRQMKFIKDNDTIVDLDVPALREDLQPTDTLPIKIKLYTKGL